MDWHRYKVTLQFRYVQVRIKPIVILYRIAFVPAQKLYWIRLLFTHENGDFGVFSVMERSCAARISKVEPVTYRIGVHTIPESFSCQHEKYSVSYEHSLNRRDTTPNKTTMHTHTHTHTHKWTTEIASGKRMETGLRCCYTGRFATTIFSATQRYNVTAML